jgi:hypothetical protein
MKFMHGDRPSTNNPLLLFQVLEDEYTALHGPLPDRYLKTKQIVRREATTELEMNEKLVAELYACLQEQQRAALCLSGGGIRSATFGLGVLQGLARHDLLNQFHYLSTVSGGGYVGGWLTSWIHRKGLSQVLQELKNPPAAKLEPEPKTIRHLREYSNFLTPKLGLLSADAWTLAATYLRNLLLNWLAIVPLLLALLMIPRFGMAISPIATRGHLWILLAAGFACTTIPIAYICLNLPTVREALKDHRHFFTDREGQASFLRWCLIPLLASAFFVTTAWAWLRNSGGDLDQQLSLTVLGQHIPTVALFMAIGMAVHTIGWMIPIGLLLHLGSRERWNSGMQAVKKFRRAFDRSQFGFLLLSGALGGLSAWILATKVFPYPGRNIEYYVCFAATSLIVSFLFAGALYVGLVSRSTSDDDREWWARSSAWILIGGIVWSGLSVVVIFGPVLLFDLPRLLLPIGGATGLLALLLGFSAKTPAPGQGAQTNGWQTTVRQYAPVLAAPVFILLLGASLALLTSWMIEAVADIIPLQTDWGSDTPLLPFQDFSEHFIILRQANWWLLALIAVGLVLISAGTARVINANKFSLHSIYRSRLIRAYLGASNERRNPNAFTGFDPEDNIEMHRLTPPLPSDGAPAKLLHIVNIALNLVKNEKLAWQERKAESFTASPLHVGNWQLGYRRSADYGKNQQGTAITLGTAVTISGAAASPNMGYHSSSAVTFLMALFNVRLGWWLGNPGKAGSDTFDKSSPKYAIGPMIQEAFGFTDNVNPYIYLSDGGHFENLGLYEMVLRHCRFIVVIDAGRDPDCAFEDLGNAIRKIRIDLGVPINLQKVRIYSTTSTRRKPDEIPKYCAIGNIGYGRLDKMEPDGVLIYIKPALCEDEPADVYNYAQVNPGFPHESTSDQWFSESQFESYRMLGSHIIEQLCGEDWHQQARTWTGPTLDLFHRQVQKYLALGAKPMSSGGGKETSESVTVSGPGVDRIKKPE